MEVLGDLFFAAGLTKIPEPEVKVLTKTQIKKLEKSQNKQAGGDKKDKKQKK